MGRWPDKGQGWAEEVASGQALTTRPNVQAGLVSPSDLIWAEAGGKKRKRRSGRRDGEITGRGLGWRRGTVFLSSGEQDGEPVAAGDRASTEGHGSGHQRPSLGPESAVPSQLGDRGQASTSLFRAILMAF